MQKKIILLSGEPVEKRYLEFINTYPNLYLKVPQRMIASDLCVTPGSLTRVMNE